mgnify:FL=1|tara:strand:- start:191 stop:439 length:249 start_codon:yes stop_codon:yes gene_type:complete
MYDPSPKITKFKKDSVTYDYKDQYFLTVEFTDPDTGEALIGGFSLWEWHKPPSDVEKDIRERLMNPIQSVAGKVAPQDQVQK